MGSAIVWTSLFGLSIALCRGALLGRWRNEVIGMWWVLFLFLTLIMVLSVVSVIVTLLGQAVT